MPEAQVRCEACGGGGVLGVVSHEMAVDAGMPEAEGYEQPCDICGGNGWIVEEVPDDE